MTRGRLLLYACSFLIDSNHRAFSKPRRTIESFPALHGAYSSSTTAAISYLCRRAGRNGNGCEEETRLAVFLSSFFSQMH